MKVVTVANGATPTKIVAAGEWQRYCDIYNDSDTTIRIVYDGTASSSLSATPGAEVGVALLPGGVIQLGGQFNPLFSNDVYGVHAAVSGKRIQIQEQ